MNWRRSLQGQKVLVTRPKEQASLLSELLRGEGAEPIECSLITLAPPEDITPVDQAIDQLENYDWVIFTSVNGVRFFFDRLKSRNINMERNRSIKTAAVGPATKGALEKQGWKIHFMPSRYLTEEIAAEIGEIAGQRILLPRADLARKELARALEAKGALVEEVTIYRTLPNSSVEKKIQEALKKGEFDWITFTSASAVRNFADLLRGEDVVCQSQVTHYPYPKNIKVACIGPITEKACKEEGIPVQTVAKEHTIEGLVDEMVKWLKS